jgi:hypothetical protein
MAEIVNLRLARKRKRRDEKEARATANRARHGEAADAKMARRIEREREERRLAGHLRQPRPPDTPE